MIRQSHQNALHCYGASEDAGASLWNPRCVNQLWPGKLDAD